MLIAERNLQMQDFFAVALKAEMSGLDHARMHRPDRYFMHFVAFDAVEIGHADERLFVGGPAPGVVAGA